MCFSMDFKTVIVVKNIWDEMKKKVKKQWQHVVNVCNNMKWVRTSKFQECKYPKFTADAFSGPVLRSGQVHQLSPSTSPANRRVLPKSHPSSSRPTAADFTPTLEPIKIVHENRPVRPIENRIGRTARDPTTARCLAGWWPCCGSAVSCRPTVDNTTPEYHENWGQRNAALSTRWYHAH